MLIGYNTDIEHDGVVYHVQTEDKGIDNPFLLSLIFSGGAILASKRSPYDDLIGGEFDESKLAERLNHQHRVICAAIRAGRIDDLRKLSAREPAVVAAETASDDTIGETTLVPTTPSEENAPVLAEPSLEAPALSPYTVFDERRGPEKDQSGTPRDGLQVSLIGEDRDFHGGEDVHLRILVANVSKGTESPVRDATVSFKVLGTSFRPIIRSLKTDRDGIAAVSGQIPPFAAGRAAILIRATVGESSSEIRRAIYPSV
jgi:hypothetical protein